VNRLHWGTYALSSFFGALVTGIAVATRPFGPSSVISAVFGLASVLAASLLAHFLRRARSQTVIGGFLGLLSGCVLGLAIVLISNAATSNPIPAIQFLRIAAPLLLGYVGLIVGVSKSANLSLAAATAVPMKYAPFGKVLDTSVLIDGRISDIVKSGFLEGTLVIPRFVLHELQAVADSADSARRARGRRGLDVVQHLQSLPNLKIEVSLQDFPATREVDLKLIEFAKLHAAKIVTNDFNLNKLAQVQGIHVLNINELASSLKPIVLPGETMRVFILKEGKEHSQGIAYLDDGTMVVVDNARRLISKTVDIVVTSVLQTTAGKMIFGRYDERPQAEIRHVSASAST
jgi:uncharacterized protein YacL